MINNILTYLSFGMIFLPDPITTVVGIGLLFLLYKYGKKKYKADRISIRLQKMFNK